MSKSTKRVASWSSGVGIGITFVLVGFLVVVAVSGGGMTNLHGEPLGSGVANITPHAGGDDMEDEEQVQGCGNYIQWIGQPVSNSALKKTGKPYRILPPNSMMSMEHNPDRINIHIDETGLIENVKCG